MNAYEKIVKIFEKHKVISILLIALILIILFTFLVPVTVQLVYQFGNSHYNQVIHTDFGPKELLGYIGTIIGSIGTFVALYITIQHENRNRKEDRRIQIRPYFVYSIVNVKEPKTAGLDVTLVNDKEQKVADEVKVADLDFTLRPPKEEMEAYIKSVNIDDYFTCQLEIKNIGANSALKLSVLEINFLGRLCYQFTGKNITVEGNKKVYFNLRVLLNIKERLKEKIQIVPVDIKLAYIDLNENYYEQNVPISCTWETHMFSDAINKPTEYGPCHAYINKRDISEAKYYKNKTIEEEEQNRLNGLQIKK